MFEKYAQDLLMTCGILVRNSWKIANLRPCCVSRSFFCRNWSSLKITQHTLKWFPRICSVYPNELLWETVFTVQGQRWATARWTNYGLNTQQWEFEYIKPIYDFILRWPKLGRCILETYWSFVWFVRLMLGPGTEFACIQSQEVSNWHGNSYASIFV